MLLYPVTNFEIQKYPNEPNFNSIYSNNLPKTKDRIYLETLGEYKLIRTHWIALYVNGNNWLASYNVDSFRVEHISK